MRRTGAPWAGEEIFAAGISSRLVLLAEQHGGQATLAFVVAACSGPDWEIQNIVVADAARRHGIVALRWSRFWIGRGPPAPRVSFSEVRGSNRAARMLYEKLGFTGCRPASGVLLGTCRRCCNLPLGLLGSPAG